ncbi:hypothetical protein ES703_36639 [subsurface metagenome]
MSFVRTKTIKGHTYYYEVRSVRDGKKVRQVIIKYFGTTPPLANVSTTADWDQAKRCLRGKHFAYVLKSFKSSDPWATGPAKRPDRGDRVEIIKRMGASCLVEFQSDRFDVMIIDLSPDPPGEMTTEARPPPG